MKRHTYIQDTERVLFKLIKRMNTDLPSIPAKAYNLVRNENQYYLIIQANPYTYVTYFFKVYYVSSEFSTFLDENKFKNFEDVMAFLLKRYGN